MSKWKLVPRTVTREIVEALNTACRSASTGREIWTAMLDAAPVPAADDCESVCDAYAAENQQFSEQLARLRAENERLKAALKPVTRDQINEAVIEVMAQAQSFASSWSLVGGRYDSGDMLDHAHKQKSELERMVRAAIDAAMAQGDKA